LVNCTSDDIRLIIDTSLEDPDITSLIVLSDAEITSRSLDSRPADILKLISMLLTASLISARDPTSNSVNEYRETMRTSEDWLKLAEEKIEVTTGTGLTDSGIPFVSYNEPIGDNY